jgi:hypothetical protein
VYLTATTGRAVVCPAGFHSFIARRCLAILSLIAAASAPVAAQTSRVFDSGIVLGGDWLQANALPLDRDAVHSGSVNLSLRRHSWGVEAGFLRIARTLSTIQGGTISAGPLLHWGPILFFPTVGGLVGKAEASRDSTGYDFVGTGGVVGHQPRYTYSSAGTAGGNLALTVEAPLFRALGVRAVASQWYFSGAPLEGDRERFLAGVGLSLRVGR